MKLIQSVQFCRPAFLQPENLKQFICASFHRNCIYYKIQDSETKLKQLFGKHALTAREIEMYLLYNDSSDLLNWFRLLENMKDLEILKCRIASQLAAEYFEYKS